MEKDVSFPKPALSVVEKSGSRKSETWPLRFQPGCKMDLGFAYRAKGNPERMEALPETCMW
jgi:hypothetical protein